MIKKIILALIFILLSQIIPLLMTPISIISTKNIVVMIANFAIWLTQPPVSAKETIENRNKDKFSVLLILVISLISVAASIIDWAYYHNHFFSITVTYAGIIILITGILLRAWSIKTLGEFFTATVQIKEDHKLITEGPYSIVRHPSYLGAWFAIVGTSLYLNSLIGFLLSFLGMLWAYYFRIRFEEEALVISFGKQYGEYQKKVKRIIPFIW